MKLNLFNSLAIYPHCTGLQLSTLQILKVGLHNTAISSMKQNCSFNNSCIKTIYDRIGSI